VDVIRVDTASTVVTNAMRGALSLPLSLLLLLTPLACDGGGEGKDTKAASAAQAKPAEAPAATPEAEPKPEPEPAPAKSFPKCEELLTVAEVKEACGIDVVINDLPLQGAEGFQCIRKGFTDDAKSHGFTFKARDNGTEATRDGKYKETDSYRQVNGSKNGVSYGVTELLTPNAKDAKFGCDQAAIEKLGTLLLSRLP
jgi:hypothetical protein